MSTLENSPPILWIVSLPGSAPMMTLPAASTDTAHIPPATTTSHMCWKKSWTAFRNFPPIMVFVSLYFLSIS